MAWLIFGVLVSWPRHVHVVGKLDILSDKRRGVTFLVDAASEGRIKIAKQGHANERKVGFSCADLPEKFVGVSDQ